MRFSIYTLPLLAALIAIPAVGHAQAQEVPRFEMSAAYMFTPQPSSFMAGDLSDGQTRSGWEADAVTNINDVFGVELSGTGSYASLDNSAGNVAIHGLMAGPRFTYREASRIAPFGRSLIGAVHRSVAGNSDTFLSAQIGGGITVYTGSHLGIVTGGDYRRSVRGLEWDDFNLYLGFSLR